VRPDRDLNDLVGLRNIYKKRKDSQAGIHMSLNNLRKDARGVVSVVIIVLIVVLMVSASSVVILLYSGNQSNSGPSSQAVVVGDTAKVDYTGRLADGRVFDTSMWSVASNDALYPKSLAFELRSQSLYTPLTFTVGSGQLIKGFDNGVIGMTVGQTKVIVVPPSQGYGEMNTSKLFYADLMEFQQVYPSMNYSNFKSNYGSSPQVGSTVQDPFFGWDVLVISTDVAADVVVVMNMPVIGQNYAVYGDPAAEKPTGWYVKIISVDSAANGGRGIIQVQNLLTSKDAGYIEGVSTSMGGTFIVDRVDERAGTYRMNFNGELIGVTLYFTVTMLEITKAS
jgi:FKBP-type peptidyl-prolyl cis-trans isomerase 2